MNSKIVSVAKSFKKEITKWVNPKNVGTPAKSCLKGVDTPSTAASSSLGEEEAVDIQFAASSNIVIDTNLFPEDTEGEEEGISPWSATFSKRMERVLFKVWVQSEWLNISTEDGFQGFQNFCVYLQEVESTLSDGHVSIE
jgi:hypothetical protein